MKKLLITISVISSVILPIGIAYAITPPPNSAQLAPTPSNGNCLTTNGSINAWGSCGSGGGGSGGGTFSTSTSNVPGQLTNHPNNNTDIVTIGSSATTTAKFFFDPNTSKAVFTGLATFANASTTQLTITGQPWFTGIGSAGGVAIDSNGRVYTFSTSTWAFASSTLLADNNTFTGNDVFSNTITGSITGNSGTATKFTTARTIAITGDLSYTSPSFDGSGNVTAAGTLATVNGNVGSFGGTNSIPTFTANGKGLLTAAGAVTPSIPASEITTGTFGAGNYIFPSTVTIPNASTTNFSSSYASSTAAYFGTLNLVNITGTQCLHSISGVVSGTGSDCGSGGSSLAWMFAGTGNATSTLTQFNGGLTAYASSTIGDGTTSGGLTINGSATTTALKITSNSGLTLGGVNGLLKAVSGAVTNSANGIDYTLISGNNCGAGNALFSISANGSNACQAAFSTTSADAYINASTTIAHPAGLGSNLQTGGLIQWDGAKWVASATSSLGFTGSGGSSLAWMFAGANNSTSTPVGFTGGAYIGTTTGAYPLTVYSATGNQLSLSNGAGVAQWTASNEGGTFYLATTTTAGNATTSPAAVQINSTGSAGLSVGTTTTTGILNLGSNGATTNATTTVFMNHIQIDGLSASGARTCAYIVGTAWVIQAGACNN